MTGCSTDARRAQPPNPNHLRLGFSAERPPRLAWVGAALLVVIVAAVTVVGVFGDQSPQMAGSPPTTAAAATTTSAASVTTTGAGATTSTSAIRATPATPAAPSPATTAAAGASAGPDRALAAQEALEGVLVMAERVAGGPMERPGTQTYFAKQLLEEAQALGVLSSAEAEELRLDEPVRRGTFALWLWRAVGEMLPPVTDVTFSDLAPLSPEEQQAIEGLARATIIRGDSQGAFHPEDELTEGDQQAILSRVAAVLGER